jgi:hypothetical protein
VFEHLIVAAPGTNYSARNNMLGDSVVFEQDDVGAY